MNTLVLILFTHLVALVMASPQHDYHLTVSKAAREFNTCLLYGRREFRTFTYLLQY
jgi:hypothetical protein